MGLNLEPQHWEAMLATPPGLHNEKHVTRCKIINITNGKPCSTTYGMCSLIFLFQNFITDTPVKKEVELEKTFP